MRIFKNKWFQRWTRKEGVPEKTLYNAAREVLEGKTDADLGGCLFKKRLARQGSGKSGGYRVIIGYKKPNTDRIIFLFGFAKNERANIRKNEEAVLRIVAEKFFLASDDQIKALLELGEAWEVKKDE